jgi:predicted RNase H-like HicB family nuclease
VQRIGPDEGRQIPTGECGPGHEGAVEEIHDHGAWASGVLTSSYAKDELAQIGSSAGSDKEVAWHAPGGRRSSFCRQRRKHRHGAEVPGALVGCSSRRYACPEDISMKLRAVIHRVPEKDGGGYWAEVPALPGCTTQGDTYDELMQNIQESIEGWLSIEAEPQARDAEAEVVEIAV